MLWSRIGEIVSSAPAMQKFLELAGSNKKRVGMAGVCESGKALAVAAFYHFRPQNILWLLPTPEEAERQRDNLSSILGEQAVKHWACWEIMPGEERGPDVELVGSRLECLWALQLGRPTMVVASARSLLQKTLSPKVFGQRVIRLARGGQLDREELMEALVNSGYERQSMVGGMGDFALRGNIIDIAGFGQKDPVRLELDESDRIVSLRTFNFDDQRSSGSIEEATILPYSEEAQNGSCLLEHLSAQAVIFWDEPGESRSAFEELKEELETYGQDQRFLSFEDCEPVLNGHPLMYLTSGGGFGVTDIAPPEETVRLSIQPVEPFLSNIKLLRERIDRLGGEGYRILILADSQGQHERLKEILGEAAPGLEIMVAGLHRGFHMPEAKLWAATEREIFARERRRQSRRFVKGGSVIRSLDKLKYGDYMVHVDYGICQYQGLVKINMDGAETECLMLLFRDGDRLYVPIEQMKRVQRYSSEEGYTPVLSKLGSGQWEETKAKVKKAAQDMAQELLAIYAKRKSLPGHAFGPDTSWQRELEASFPYQETPDQLRALSEIKRDMESDRPMDRLLCGDVGYGKTEVAVRAAFKAVMDGFQVAVLAPTTVLAEQHFLTFKERMAAFPVRIEMLSRFRSLAEQRSVVKAIKEGKVDIIIGTHRLLQRDVAFFRLGLLIIDEEQRFGVAHKERIKKLCSTVDVLTMTATPIPRTLHMSLLGVRDVSNIETPPKDRLSVLTEVVPWDEKIIREAVLRELDRDGQVFFLHNRVQSISAMAALLSRLLPGVEIVTAHGQMPARELERAMLAFNSRRYDILVSTSIIESGLDMPNVNTIIINRADRFGLAQLYQLRGRVGRSDRRAYAYMIIPRGGVINEVARKRLRIIEELSELGSGFQLALRDLEIRGAGNLLGREQHGHMMAVGFELYCQLLEEAVRELKGLTPVPQLEVKLEIDSQAMIPEEYVEEGQERIDFYRRLNRVRSLTAIDDIAAEIEDRFGRPPVAVVKLLDVARLRLAAASLGCQRLVWKGNELSFYWPEGREPSLQRLEQLIKAVALPMEFVSGKRFMAKMVLGRDVRVDKLTWAVMSDVVDS